MFYSEAFSSAVIDTSVFADIPKEGLLDMRGLSPLNALNIRSTNLDCD